MGRNLKLLISLVAIAVLYCTYYFGVPALVNRFVNDDFLVQNTKNSLGYEIDIKNSKFKVGFLPSLIFKCDKFIVFNNDDSIALSANNLDIDVRILPLLFKNIEFKNFNADNLFVNFVFDGNLLLGKYQIILPEKQLFVLNKLRANIKKYSIILNDITQKKQIKLEGDQFKVDNYTKDRNLALQMNANLFVNNKKSELLFNSKIKLPITKISKHNFSLDANISNLDLSVFSVYAKSFSKGQIESLSGILNLVANTESENNILNTRFDITDLGVYNDNLSTSIYYKEKLDVNSSFNILDDGLFINNVSIAGNGIDVNFNGLVKDLSKNLPFLDIKVSVKNSKAEKLLQLLPAEPDLNPDINLLSMKQAGFWGNANGSLIIKGRADYPNVYGNVFIKDAYLVRPIKNASKARINLDFLGERMKLDVDVPTDKNEKVLVNGEVILDKERTADLYITSTKNVDLKTAQIVLNPLHEILRFDIGPVPIMDIKGKGGINLHVIGTRKNPYGWGSFWFQNTTASFNDIKNVVLTNASGVLNFDKQNAIFKTEFALLNGKPTLIEGNCSLFGDLDFKVFSKQQESAKLLKAIQTSPMLADIQNLLSPIENISGLLDLKLNLTGQVKDINDIVFNKNIFAMGSLNLFSNTVKLQGLNAWVPNISGSIEFENLDVKFDLKSRINKSIIILFGKIKDKICDVHLKSDKFILADGLRFSPINIPYSKDLASISSAFQVRYSGDIENIDLNRLKVNGKIFSNQGAKSSIIVNNSNFELLNGNFKTSVITGLLKGNPFNLFINSTNIFSNKRNVNGYCKFANLDLNLLNESSLLPLLPSEVIKLLKDTEFINGKINVSARISNNSLNVFSILDDLNLKYKDLNINVNSGNLFLKNDVLNINKLNINIGEMPFFANGKISNIFKVPNFNLYVNTKPTQDFVDQIFNNNTLYPIKIKGDVILSSKLDGILSALRAKTVLDISENSNIYYMGATLGDVENPVKITVDETYYPNKIRINNFEYDKFIMSQNDKPVLNPQLKASGMLSLLENNTIGFENFKIKTEAPTDAKIFNIIFRKPFMKQGVFISDLILNGTSVYPKILGSFNITSIDIPFLNSTIKDINFEFKPDKIYVLSKGNVLTNDVQMEAVLKNKFSTPYIVENLNLSLVDLDINKISETIRDIEAESARKMMSYQTSPIFDLSNVVVNKAQINANKIYVRNINADNFKANLNLSDKNRLKVNDFVFHIADGIVNGSLEYDLVNFKTDLSINLNNANALVMSEALFDLKGQVYGSVNGNFDLSCDGASQETCFKTLSGNGNFNISDGRMPKLGSLEYLLKAGNLFKGGLTGLSINSIIDLITPLKTGDFESIYGSVKLTDGTADNIQIFSKGKDLNMYMKGSYNILTSVADMQILGSLSKNITTVFGKIKNASLNTLFNTIPGVNTSDETILMQTDISNIPNIQNATDIFRIFAVDINGDINGENYVRSFEWVK